MHTGTGWFKRYRQGNSKRRINQFMITTKTQLHCLAPSPNLADSKWFEKLPDNEAEF